VFCLSGTLDVAPGLRIRPVFEWDGCLVFDPARRRLIELNLTSWLMLELCDGRPYAALREEFAAVIGARAETADIDRHLRSGLLGLAAAGLIRRSPGGLAVEGEGHDEERS
jgi:hypothetical protein